MKTRTKSLITILKIASWVIFFGLCIQTGAITYSYIVSLINPVGANNVYKGLNLSALYNYDIGYYHGIMLFMIFISALKAYMFYNIIKIFFKINTVHPFSTDVLSLINRICYAALFAGALAFVANLYTEWLMNKGIGMPALNLQQYIGSNDGLLFLAAILFVIAQVFKSGIEIQSENELTV